MSVVQQNPSVGAGQYYSTLVFTNTSNSSCTMSGYPVSRMSSPTVSSPATPRPARAGARPPSPSPRAARPAPRCTTATASRLQPAAVPAHPAQGLRIYPPNQKAALFVPWKTSHCAGLSIHPLTIGPITQ
ncbi:DUF4232 domain-containing protein [Streptacidiphilus sp. 4-A2]|nr:DUF4232 domain-containing protein [Streptacidiphilus sp. 4-A2]